MKIHPKWFCFFFFIHDTVSINLAREAAPASLPQQKIALSLIGFHINWINLIKPWCYSAEVIEAQCLNMNNLTHPFNHSATHARTHSTKTLCFRPPVTKCFKAMATHGNGRHNPHTFHLPHGIVRNLFALFLLSLFASLLEYLIRWHNHYGPSLKAFERTHFPTLCRWVHVCLEEPIRAKGQYRKHN